MLVSPAIFPAVSLPSSPANAFKTLYSDHHSWLNHWLRKKLGNSFDAADLTHDTFMRVLTSTDTATLREPRAFLTTVASGLLSNFYRRRKIEQSYLDALSILPDQDIPSPEVRMMVLETLIEIDGLLDGLPGDVRKAFLWSQLDGLGQAEIARQLGVSVSTVKRYIVRAVQQCCFGEGS
ncbi:sigma-70 family RNA polymerase sigma factor [Methylobacillus caricis]|uniref:sigma-70 family RNA polymerase sigma factor n=1 Tax=Methylobacillus caricis TaxID=1971611 RepID=UPI001CFF997E|nr:sigma-70 family RNA polymerase sigma factor [Methylobacillus caricis]MCB5189017.1 sigma-70 family RNA polymerase sigma factor [Methylobacillus caricis]